MYRQFIAFILEFKRWLSSDQRFAQCKVIQIPEFTKQLLEESGIQKIFDCGIRNPRLSRITLHGAKRWSHICYQNSALLNEADQKRCRQKLRTISQKLVYSIIIESSLKICNSLVPLKKGGRGGEGWGWKRISRLIGWVLLNMKNIFVS